MSEETSVRRALQRMVAKARNDSGCLCNQFDIVLPAEPYEQLRAECVALGMPSEAGAASVTILTVNGPMKVYSAEFVAKWVDWTRRLVGLLEQNTYPELKPFGEFEREGLALLAEMGLTAIPPEPYP